jgi:hypothetical protein
MVSHDEWKQLEALLEEAAKAIHEAFERNEEPSKSGSVRTLLDRVIELRLRLRV